MTTSGGSGCFPGGGNLADATQPGNLQYSATTVPRKEDKSQRYVLMTYNDVATNMMRREKKNKAMKKMKTSIVINEGGQQERSQDDRGRAERTGRRSRRSQYYPWPKVTHASFKPDPRKMLRPAVF